MLRRTFVIGGALVLLAGVLLGFQLGLVFFSNDTLKALEKLQKAFLIIHEQYVEDVDSADLAESALRGMLEELDPHSVYIDAERMRRVEEDFSGGFEGVGISYEFIRGTDGQDTLTVLTVIPGGPSEEAGLWSGDRIIEVDGESVLGITNDDVQRTLKGPRGTKVDITLIRPGYENPFSVTVTRDRIPLYSVDVAYMVDEQTGYIKVSRFARTTHREFTSALRGLQEQGVKRLVLDLRGNAGGYMEMAISMADDFLSDGESIVSQRGRERNTNREFYARGGGRFEEKPVIVLVNSSSASASEIVAGALQDHDRALIVGEQTFGKALVQQQYELTDGSAMRVTVSHFYTPSGRLIQTPYVAGNVEDYFRTKKEMRDETRLLSLGEIIERVPDSLQYSTTGGRTVIGGGGILPDYIVRPDSATAYMQAVYAANVINTFARSWFDQHGEDLRQEWGEQRKTFVGQFQVSDEMFEHFLAFSTEYGISISDSDGENGFSRQQVETDRMFVEAQIKGRLAVMIFGLGSYYPVWHEVDRVFIEAMKLWPEAGAITEL